MSILCSTKLTREIDYDVEGGRSDGPLSNRLRDEKEVVPLRLGHGRVDDGPRRRIRQLTSAWHKESMIDPLLNDDEGELGIVLGRNLMEGRLDLDDFVLHHRPQLPVRDPVSIKDYAVRKLALSRIKVFT